MKLRLYNTLTRAKEEFAPADNTTARVYSCGPTVYSRQHIGNMRAAVFTDVLKRALRYSDYSVEDVVNITDVGHLASDEDEGEDKVARAARESGKDPFEVARHFEELYWHDLERLNIVPPKYRPRATEHIAEQIDFIKTLEARGLTYATDDGVYFDTEKLPNYGKLSRQRLEGKEAGARVAVRGGKHNPRDFALWKFLVGEHVSHAMRWESPWGAGFPGWHIECSAMGRRYLGETIDIHTGGIEHIPVHHENEIAQNEGSGLLTARFWLHNEHLLLTGGKMSKSLGNILSLDDLAARSVSPLSFRYWLLTAHYRSSVNFTWEAVEGAQQALIRLCRHLFGHRMSKDVETPKSKASQYIEMFRERINDDLDTPGALATLWHMVKDDSVPIEEKRETLLDFDRVLGLGLAEYTDELLALSGAHVVPIEKLPLDVRQLLSERDAARASKNWVQADALRAVIHSHGYTIEDMSEGSMVLLNEHL